MSHMACLLLLLGCWARVPDLGIPAGEGVGSHAELLQTIFLTMLLTNMYGKPYIALALRDCAPAATTGVCLR